MRYRNEVLAFAAGVLVVLFLGGIFLAGRASSGPPAFSSVALIATALPTAVPTPTAIPSPTPIPSPTSVPGLPCAAASQIVHDRHAMIFNFLTAMYPPAAFDCGVPDGQGTNAVTFTWTDKQGGRHIAVYLISATGVVTSADTNAKKIDEAAKLGPAALSALGL